MHLPYTLPYKHPYKHSYNTLHTQLRSRAHGYLPYIHASMHLPYTHTHIHTAVQASMQTSIPIHMQYIYNILHTQLRARAPHGWSQGCICIGMDAEGWRAADLCKPYSIYIYLYIYTCAAALCDPAPSFKFMLL
jgi:hypothetical protein